MGIEDSSRVGIMEKESLVAIVSPASYLGLEIKRTEGLADNEAIKMMLKEAERLGTIKEIKINETDSIVILTTVAASPHTYYAVPYEDFAKKWREAAKEGYPNPPAEGDLVAKEERKEALVPLHFITWIVKKSQDVYEELDFFDLLGLEERYDKVRGPALKGLDEDKRVELVTLVYEELKERMIFHSKFLADLYAEIIYSKIEEAISELDLEKELKERLLDVLESPGYVDNTLPIGHYSKWNEDGLGRGPQSNPKFHSHSAIYPSPERIWEVVYQFYRKSTDTKESIGMKVLDKIKRIVKRILESIQHKFIYRESTDIKALNDFETIINGMNEVLAGGLEFQRLSEEEIFKQVDPYSMLFFREAKTWVVSRLREYLENYGLKPEIEVFSERKHPVIEGKRVLMRFSQGVKLEVPIEDFAKVNLALGDFVKELYFIWGSYLESNSLDEFGLPDNLLKLIERIRPVKEVDEVAKRGSRVLRKFASRQLLKSTGYNIPGVPALGVTYEFDLEKNTVVITIGPLLSKKGIAEHVGGISFRRQEAAV